MHVVAALLFSLFALGALGLIAQMLVTEGNRIMTALTASTASVDPGYVWVARVRRVARPAPAVSRFRPLPRMVPSRAHA